VDELNPAHAINMAGFLAELLYRQLEFTISHNVNF